MSLPRYGVLLLVALMAVAPAQAQVGGSALDALAGSGGNPLTQLRQRLAQTGLSTSSLPMEGVVDAATYVVGPGDAFSVTVNGQSMTPAPVSVSADGILVLPDAGAVVVGGLSLANAREESMRLLRKAYADADVTLTLVQSRQFYVHVSGAVPRPGRYLALPVARVSSILELAFADTVSVPVTNPAFRPSLRNIRILRGDGSEQGVDLLQYFSSGDRDSNPYLQDGDVIFVPAYQPSTSSVFVDGAVPFPGAYDFRPGDTVQDLLALAGGLDPGAARRVRVVRKTGSVLDMSVADAVGEPGARVALQVRDRVDVIIPDEILGQATLTGQVQYPGTYPIFEGETTLQQLVDMAGGLRDGALLRGAYLERRSLPDPMQSLAGDRFSPRPDPADMISLADTSEIMQRLRLTEMDFLSRVYFAQEVRLQNRVSVDFTEALSGDGAPVYLRSGDRVVIPRNPDAVFVFGQVNRPGFVTFREGQSVEDFISLAGGRGPEAKDVYVVHPATGQVASIGDRPMESGDFLFVDRKTDYADNAALQALVIQERSMRANTRDRTLQTVVQSIGTLASVVALIISIRRQ